VKKTDKLQQLKQTGEAPDWMTDEGFKTLSGTYLLPGESPKAMWERVSNSVAGYLKKPELAAKFFDLLWKNWLGLASPVAANCGTDRGLPISCFSTFVPDSIDGIMGRMHELATMTKNGGGVGVHWNKVRPRNAIIRGNGRSEGVVPFIKIQDSTTVGVSQGGVRRGASAAYLPVEHGDFWEFIKMRRPEGDQNRQCQNVHHGVNVTDEFMQSLKDGHKENRLKWQEILKTRMETGEPYIFFTDTVKNSRPESYVKNNLEVNGSNICCLSGDTLVATKAGPVRIDELCGKEVEIWDGNDWVVTGTFSERGKDKLWRVVTADGSTTDCNEKHRWFAAKTPEGPFEEVLTKDLTPGMFLETSALSTKETGMSCVEAIIPLGSKKHPVYCPTLPTTGKFALANGLMTGNTEILLATDEMHSFVCCLSSLNLARWDEWKDTDAVELSVWFLDGVLSEFIDKASKIEGMERSVRSAVAGRALGLGVFGFHTYLQEHSVVLDSFECFQINAQMFSGIKRKAEKATQELAAEYGEPEWCKGLNRRNTHLIALAPTVSNSLISGNLSPSIEPWAANVFVQKSAKGTIIQKNKTLTKLLESYGKNNEATWKSIERENGSVQHLDFLTSHEKEVFLTAKEMNQFALVKLAAQRQRWIDQGQSLNLFFPENSDPKYIHDVHVMAHEEGLRTLYYLRTSSVIRGDAGSREYRRESTECKACEG
jgi:ribonucleotide reductase alpha subunit